MVPAAADSSTNALGGRVCGHARSSALSAPDDGGSETPSLRCWRKMLLANSSHERKKATTQRSDIPTWSKGVTRATSECAGPAPTEESAKMTMLMGDVVKRPRSKCVYFFTVAVRWRLRSAHRRPCSPYACRRALGQRRPTYRERYPRLCGTANTRVDARGCAASFRCAFSAP